MAAPTANVLDAVMTAEFLRVRPFASRSRHQIGSHAGTLHRPKSIIRTR